MEEKDTKLVNIISRCSVVLGMCSIYFGFCHQVISLPLFQIKKANVYFEDLKLSKLHFNYTHTLLPQNEKCQGQIKALCWLLKFLSLFLFF